MTTGGNRTLKVTIVGDSKDAERAIRELEISMGNLDRTAVRTGAAAGAGFAAVTKGIDLLVAGGRAAVGVGLDLLNSYRESERAGTRLDAVLRATGNTLRTTKDDILAYSTELQHATGTSDEEITNVQTLLLTFREIGPEVFGKTTELALDMSAVFGQDLSSSAITLGKALQDPIQGVTALRRIGVQLSDTQEQQIRKFAEVNDVLGAQKVILSEVEQQVGGTARAMGEDGAGKIDRLTQAIDDLKEVAGEAIAEGLDPLIDATLEWAESEDAITFAKELGDAIAGLGSTAGSIASILRDIGTLVGAAYESWVPEPLKNLGIKPGAITALFRDAAAPFRADTAGIAMADAEREAEDASVRRWLARTADGRFLGGAPAAATSFGVSPKSGGAGSAPTMFGAAGLATIAGFVSRAPGSPSAGDVAGYEAARLGFAGIQQELKESMLTLGLTMADLDARGLEQTDAFKDLDEQMKVLRDASQRLRDLEELRLGTIADSIEATRELQQAQKEHTEQMLRTADELYARLSRGGNLSAASSRGAFLAAAAAARRLEGSTDANGNFIPKEGGTFDGTTLQKLGPGAGATRGPDGAVIVNYGTVTQVFPGVQAESAAIAAAGATE